MTQIEKVPVELVECYGRHRAINESRVGSLMESVSAIGLQTPISVWFFEDQDGDQHVHLVAGLHRLEVARRLGWQEIDCIYVEMDQADRELWEIDENLCRSELTDAEEARHLARRKELWEARETAANSGKTLPTIPPKRGRGMPQGFAAETAAITGQSKRAINQKIARAEKIAPDVLNEVAGTELDKGTFLDQLAKTPRDQQRAKVAELQANQQTKTRRTRAEIMTERYLNSVHGLRNHATLLHEIDISVLSGSDRAEMIALMGDATHDIREFVGKLKGAADV